jgi:hypothetical protein
MIGFKTACAYRFNNLFIGELKIFFNQKKEFKNEKICFSTAFAVYGCLAVCHHK